MTDAWAAATRELQGLADRSRAETRRRVEEAVSDLERGYHDDPFFHLRVKTLCQFIEPYTDVRTTQSVLEFLAAVKVVNDVTSESLDSLPRSPEERAALTEWQRKVSLWPAQSFTWRDGVGFLAGFRAGVEQPEPTPSPMHAAQPGPEYWNWRCLVCGEAVDDHPPFWARLKFRWLHRHPGTI